MWPPLPLLVRTSVRLFSPKWTVGALAILTNEQNQVLLVKHRGRAQPWGLPGGILKHPEAPLQGLCRELREELCLPVDAAFLQIQEPLIGIKLPLLELIYCYKKSLSPLEISKIKLQKLELLGLHWVGTPELAEQKGILDRHRSLVDRFLRSAPASHKEMESS